MRFSVKRRFSIFACVLVVATIAALLGARIAGSGATPSAHAAPAAQKPFCTARPQLCTELTNPWNAQGQYTGHDEPSLLFYSNQPGSGNSNFYSLTLPQDPSTAPNQDGTGSTWAFQRSVAIWFGMIMCDDQDAPTPGKHCTADSDTNIYTSLDPHSPNYIGNTPGEAYMEFQFYPDGWGPVSCTDANGVNDNTWCSAMTIDSDQENLNTGAQNNAACQNTVGPEPVNYAIVTKSGHPVAPANPFEGFGNQAITTSDTLKMHGGDQIAFSMKDTPAGFQIVVHDATTGQSGSMTASVANGFGHAKFDPNAKKCTEIPYAYHPMFSTSTKQTNVYWAAHTYNVAYSDELGHFEYCNAADPNTLACTQAGANDPSGLDDDDQFCLTAGPETLTGCLSDDEDFDGTSYLHDWPGSTPNHANDAALHGTAVNFSSPLFMSQNGNHWNSGDLRNYQTVAFETDLPRIEGADISPNNNCQRHVYNPSDPNPGAGCVDPPNGAAFYPYFQTVRVGGQCFWQEGDSYLPNVTDHFGGSAHAEFGGLLENIYPTTGNQTEGIYETFHRDLSSNPCPTA